MDGDGRKKRKRKIKKSKKKSKKTGKKTEKSGVLSGKNPLGHVLVKKKGKPVHGKYGQYITTPDSKRTLKPKTSVSSAPGYAKNYTREEKAYDRELKLKKEIKEYERLLKEEEAVTKSMEENVADPDVLERILKEEAEKYGPKAPPPSKIPVYKGKQKESKESKDDDDEYDENKDYEDPDESSYYYDPPSKIPILKKGTGKEDGLYDSEIWRAMKIFPDFVGVISRDEILKMLPWMKNKRRLGFIVNRDPHTKGGSHWFSVYVDARPEGTHTLEVYDSFGRVTPSDIKDDLKLLVDSLKPPTLLKFKENHVVNQANSSSTCGYMASRFLIDRMRNVSFCDATHYSSIAESEKDAKKLPEFKYI